MSRIRSVLELINYDLGLDINRDEVLEILRALKDQDDFYQEIDGNEYRFISDFAIWDVYVEEIQHITEDCYEIKAPAWLEIDWEQTAKNCYIDGYGHTFSHYDGNEYEFTIRNTDGITQSDWWVFRTN